MNQMLARYAALFVCFRVMFAAEGANAADGHTIRGIVTTNDGLPLAKARILLRADETGNAEYGTLTATDGTFIVRNVANGRYRFFANKDGYLPWTGQSKPRWPSPNVTFVITDSSGDRNLRIELTRASSISGRIFDERGDPILGAQVRIYKRSNFFGEWRFSNLPAAGNYAEADDHGWDRRQAQPARPDPGGPCYS